MKRGSRETRGLLNHIETDKQCLTSLDHSTYQQYWIMPGRGELQVLYAGADLGLLQWWGCSSNAREARAKNFGPRSHN